MSRPWLQAWLSRAACFLRGDRHYAGSRPRHRSRLVVESLESRWVPSTVTNLMDSGSGSLRDAIASTPAGDTVDFKPGLSGTIVLYFGELGIVKDLTIAGPGAGVITVSGNNASRVFRIAASSAVAISGLTIANGLVSGSTVLGGGIDNDGMLTLADCTLSSNSVNANQIITAGFGGGIANAGTLIVTNCALSGNVVSGGNIVRGGVWGGAIYNRGTLMITDSTLSGNSASGSGFYGSAAGGGIGNAGTLIVTDSTLSGNSAIGTGLGGTGGAISNSGMLTVLSSTLSENHANTSGGGISGGQVSVSNTIVAGNTGLSAPDISGALDSQGHNLIGDGTGGSGYDPTDLVGTSECPIDPLLGPLEDNGGPTQTMALLPGSPALDAGDPDQIGSIDQRGVVRSGDINIGAYQASATAFLISAPDTVQSGVPFDVTVTAVDPFGRPAVGYTGTVTFSTRDTDPNVVLPADYTFALADGGIHTFTDTGLGETTLITPGDQTLSVTDTADGMITGTTLITVDGTGSRIAPAGRPVTGKEHSGKHTADGGATSSRNGRCGSVVCLVQRNKHRESVPL